MISSFFYRSRCFIVILFLGCMPSQAQLDFTFKDLGRSKAVGHNMPLKPYLDTLKNLWGFTDMNDITVIEPQYKAYYNDAHKYSTPGHENLYKPFYVMINRKSEVEVLDSLGRLVLREKVKQKDVSWGLKVFDIAYNYCSLCFFSDTARPLLLIPDKGILDTRTFKYLSIGKSFKLWMDHGYLCINGKKGSAVFDLSFKPVLNTAYFIPDGIKDYFVVVDKKNKKSRRIIKKLLHTGKDTAIYADTRPDKGLLNLQNKLVIPFRHGHYMVLDDSSGRSFIWARDDEKLSIYDSAGTLLRSGLMTSNSYIQQFPSGKNPGRDVATGKHGVIGYDGSILIPFEYDTLIPIPLDKRFLLCKQGKKFGLMDMKGQIQIGIQYDTISAFNLFLNWDEPPDFYRGVNADSVDLFDSGFHFLVNYNEMFKPGIKTGKFTIRKGNKLYRFFPDTRQFSPVLPESPKSGAAYYYSEYHVMLNEAGEIVRKHIMERKSMGPYFRVTYTGPKGYSYEWYDKNGYLVDKPNLSKYSFGAYSDSVFVATSSQNLHGLYDVRLDSFIMPVHFETFISLWFKANSKIPQYIFADGYIYKDLKLLSPFKFPVKYLEVTDFEDNKLYVHYKVYGQYRINVNGRDLQLPPAEKIYCVSQLTVLEDSTGNIYILRLPDTSYQRYVALYPKDFRTRSQFPHPLFYKNAGVPYSYYLAKEENGSYTILDTAGLPVIKDKSLEYLLKNIDLTSYFPFGRVQYSYTLADSTKQLVSNYFILQHMGCYGFSQNLVYANDRFISVKELKPDSSIFKNYRIEGAGFTRFYFYDIFEKSDRFDSFFHQAVKKAWRYELPDGKAIDPVREAIENSKDNFTIKGGEFIFMCTVPDPKHKGRFKTYTVNIPVQTLRPYMTEKFRDMLK